MKRNRKIGALLLLVLSALGCFLLFGCAEETAAVPEVTNVAITADEGCYGKAGAVHRVGYTVPEGCSVGMSVQLGGKPATAADYACRGEEIYFYTEGEYTVTVYAAKDGMVGRASAKISVSAAEVFVSDVTLRGTDDFEGKVGGLHALSYSASADSEIGVAFFKEGEEAADVKFDGRLDTVIFGSAGSYTVKVTATRGEKTATSETVVEIAPLKAPEVSLSGDKKSLKEEDTLILTKSVKCEVIDSVSSENISVLYRKGGSGAYHDAEADLYDLNGDLFTPHVAGRWKLVYEVTSAWGGAGSAELQITSSVSAVSLSRESDERYRIQTGQPTEISYLAEGATEKYDVSFDTHGNENVTAEAGAGCSVRVTAAEVDYFTVTVVYTHKVNSSTQKRLDLDFYSVESLVYAPAWGSDPFGGMPSEVLTCMGHLLYFDAVSCGGVDRKFTSLDATYTVVENNVTATADGTNVDILYAANDESAPYVIVSNFDACVAEGNFTLKVVVTDPFTGYSAVATKLFTVLPTTNENAVASERIANYIAEHDFYQMSDMNFDNVGHDCRLNMILTKTGAILHRTNQNWPLQNGQDFAHADLNGTAENCRLEFDFRLVAANSASGEARLGVGLRTGGKDGWAGFLNVGVAKGKLALSQELGGRIVSSAAEMPSVSDGETLSVRIDRSLNGSAVFYAVSVGKAGGEYTECLRFTCDRSAQKGNAGAPVAQYQFSHRGDGGCYAVENVRLSESL